MMVLEADAGRSSSKLWVNKPRPYKVTSKLRCSRNEVTRCLSHATSWDLLNGAIIG